MIITGNLMPDLREQAELLFATPVGTVVLDRDFGIDMSFIDMPISVAINMAAAELAVKLEKYIPQLSLVEVGADYAAASEGKTEFEAVIAQT